LAVRRSAFPSFSISSSPSTSPFSFHRCCCCCCCYCQWGVTRDIYRHIRSPPIMTSILFSLRPFSYCPLNNLLNTGVHQLSTFWWVQCLSVATLKMLRSLFSYFLFICFFFLRAHVVQSHSTQKPNNVK